MDNYSTNLVGLVKAAGWLPFSEPVNEKLTEFGRPIGRNVVSAIGDGARSFANRAMAAGHIALGNDAKAQEYSDTAAQYANKQNMAHMNIKDALGAAGNYGLAALKRGDAAFNTLLGRTGQAKEDMEFVREHDAKYNTWKQGRQAKINRPGNAYWQNMSDTEAGEYQSMLNNVDRDVAAWKANNKPATRSTPPRQLPKQVPSQSQRPTQSSPRPNMATARAPMPKTWPKAN